MRKMIAACVALGVFLSAQAFSEQSSGNRAGTNILPSLPAKTSTMVLAAKDKDVTCHNGDTNEDVKPGTHWCRNHKDEICMSNGEWNNTGKAC